MAAFQVRRRGAPIGIAAPNLQQRVEDRLGLGLFDRVQKLRVQAALSGFLRGRHGHAPTSGKFERDQYRRAGLQRGGSCRPVGPSTKARITLGVRNSAGLPLKPRRLGARLAFTLQRVRQAAVVRRRLWFRQAGDVEMRTCYPSRRRAAYALRRDCRQSVQEAFRFVISWQHAASRNSGMQTASRRPATLKSR